MIPIRRVVLFVLVVAGGWVPARSFASPLSGSASGSGAGVTGTGTSGATGVSGTSDSSYGVSGSSAGVAVIGVSTGGASTGIGVGGSCTNCPGVVGYSTNNDGVRATSSNSNAVTASGGWNGVYGTTSSTNPLTAGVHGGSATTGNGVFAENSSTGNGLYATSAQGNAIYASSGTTDAIVGVAGTGAGSTGLWGKAHGAGTYGVYSSGDLYVKGVTGSPGNAYKPGGGSWTATSDARVKKDVARFTPALTELAKVHPVRFKYNGLGGTADTGKEYVGVIAQDLEKVLPFMVSAQKRKLRESDRETTDVKEVDPSAFTYVLINAVNELSRQNQAKDAQYQALAAQVQLLLEQNQRVTAVADALCEKQPGSELCAPANRGAQLARAHQGGP